jgi:molybdopterin converting factor small subunit
MGKILVKFKLFGGLKPPYNIFSEVNGVYSIELEEGYTVSNFIDLLSLSGKSLIVVINGIVCNDYNKELKNGDTISFFPPVAGG